MSGNDARGLLVRILQHAHAGELAAGNAYRGHAASVSDPREKAEIRRIEDEEWVHRRQVGEMLAALEEAPNRARELLEMAEVEWDHEAYFESHWLHRVIRLWPAIPPRRAVRAGFALRNPAHSAAALATAAG